MLDTDNRDTMIDRVNELLLQYANQSEYGYHVTPWSIANYRYLLDTFASSLHPCELPLSDYLVLNDDIADADLQELHELTEGLQDYPAIDDEIVSEVEWEFLCEMVAQETGNMARDCNEVTGIAYTLQDLGCYIEYSEYGATVSDEDFALAKETWESGEVA